VLVTNRTFERAERLAGEFDGEAIPFEELFDHLHKADIILTSTGATQFIITPGDLEAVIRRRRMQPMFMIDIAVPRDIDPAVNRLDAVYLYDLDDLQQVVAANLEGRRQEADKAEAIIAEEIKQFYKWVATLEVTPTIVALRNRFDELRRLEVERTLLAWKDAPPDAARRLDALTTAMVNKILHHPTSLLKKAGQGNRTDLYLDALQALFDLERSPAEDQELELEE